MFYHKAKTAVGGLLKMTQESGSPKAPARRMLGLVISLLLALPLAGCEDQRRVAAIKKDMMDYEGLPDPWASCVAEGFVEIATDEEAEAWIAMTRGDRAAALQNEGALTTAEQKWKMVYGSCLGEESPVTEESAAVASSDEIQIFASDAAPLPRAGQWDVTVANDVRYIAAEGESRQSTETYTECMGDIRAGPWAFPARENCTQELVSKHEGVVEFQERCIDPEVVDVTEETTVTVEYDRSRIRILQDMTLSAESMGTEPLVQQTTEITKEWVSQTCE